MKKIFVLLTMLVGVVTAQASLTPDPGLTPNPSPNGEGNYNGEGSDYTYLTFETTDGAKASVSVEELTLSISGTTLTAGTQTFTLTNLSKMYFSNTDDTTGVEEITSATLDEATDIYDLQGHKVTKAQMTKGVYIVKTKSRTYKMVVR